MRASRAGIDDGGDGKIVCTSSAIPLFLLAFETVAIGIRGTFKV